MEHPERMPDEPVYVFAGGGTGGHLFPGLAVAAELQSRVPGTRVFFAGSGRDVERRIVRQHGHAHHVLPIRPSTALRRNPFGFAWSWLRSVQAARRLLRELRPRAVIGLGGFASVPVVRAAQRAGVPTVLLEQNLVPGRATRWLAGRADCVCTSFAETDDLPRDTRVELTGNPVRPEVAALHARPRGVQDEGVRRLLVLGGSQGATGVNEALLSAAANLREVLSEWRIVHQSGAAQFDHVRRESDRLGLEAEVRPFFEDVAGLYAGASLAVSRGGATTLAELACAGVPSVLIPYPRAIYDHQTVNAEWYAAQGASLVVSPTHETPRQLEAVLRRCLTQAGFLERLANAASATARPEAAQRVADVVQQSAHGP